MITFLKKTITMEHLKNYNKKIIMTTFKKTQSPRIIICFIIKIKKI